MNKETYTTGQFAKMANVSLRTVRFYDKEGLLNPSFVGENGYRYYTKEDFLKLQQILSLKFLGFSLDQIRTAIFDRKVDFRQSLDFQKKMIKRKIDLLSSSLDIIDGLEDSLSEDKEIEWDRIIDLVRISSMEKTIVEHYENSNNLNVRISLHDKYSANPLGWYNWLLSLLELEKRKTILEIGCGDGFLWQKANPTELKGKQILLTDSSEGMIIDAKSKLGDSFKYQVADGAKLELNKKYDCIIANHVLFYLSDIPSSLDSYSKSLKRGGIFMCSTYGPEHLKEITMLCSEFDSRIKLSDVELYERFGKQNGYDILKGHFKSVEWKQYDDKLVVDDSDAVLSYVLSCHGNQNEILRDRLDEFRDFLRSKAKNGPLIITKDAGCFICHN